MNSLLIAVAVALQAAPAAQPVTQPGSPAVSAPRTLQSLPGIKITYYDVTGKDMKAINKSLARVRGRDPATKQPNTVGTSWNVSPGIKRRTENGVCTAVEVVDYDFSASAELPRLASEATLPAALVADWKKFVAQLEAEAAAKLWYVHDRLPEFDRAVLNKPCDQAMKDGGAFLAKLKADAVAFTPAPVAAASATQSN